MDREETKLPLGCENNTPGSEKFKQLMGYSEHLLSCRGSGEKHYPEDATDPQITTATRVCAKYNQFINWDRVYHVGDDGCIGLLLRAGPAIHIYPNGDFD
jgi:hypothetical protein